MLYCAICTSSWISGNHPDESFTSEDFDEALSFLFNRQDKIKQGCIIKINGQREEEIVSFRTVK